MLRSYNNADVPRLRIQYYTINNFKAFVMNRPVLHQAMATKIVFNQQNDRRLPEVLCS